jgi:hypothetical protein
MSGDALLRNPITGTAAWSHASSNRVRHQTRILKIRNQRPANETRPTSPEKEKIAPLRLSIISLTQGNLAQIFASQTWPAKRFEPTYGGIKISLIIQRFQGAFGKNGQNTLKQYQ